MSKIDFKELGAWVAVIGLFVAFLAGVVFYNQWAYGDWTCAVKTCVQTKRGEE